jgi:hypothetical protein
MIVTGGVFWVCVGQNPLGLVIQEPDVLIAEIRLQNGYIEMLENFCLDVKGLSASPLPPTKVPHATKGQQSKIEEAPCRVPAYCSCQVFLLTDLSRRIPEFVGRARGPQRLMILPRGYD